LHGASRPVPTFVGIALDKVLTYSCNIGESFDLVIDAKSPHWEKVMKNLALKVRRFLVSEDGPTAVEYAVMLALIIIVCLTAINSIGTNANLTFTDVANSIATS
jgi:pilus assembly protein Flp/PilA